MLNLKFKMKKNRKVKRKRKRNLTGPNLSNLAQLHLLPRAAHSAPPRASDRSSLRYGPMSPASLPTARTHYPVGPPSQNPYHTSQPRIDRIPIPRPLVLCRWWWGRMARSVSSPESALELLPRVSRIALTGSSMIARLRRQLKSLRPPPFPL